MRIRRHAALTASVYSRSMHSRHFHIAVLVAGLVALGGCSAQPLDTPSEAPPTEVAGSQATDTASSSPTPSPTTTLTAEAVALPTCAELLTIEHVRVALNEERIEGPEVLDAIAAPSVLGPAARDVFAAATAAVGCSYGIPYSDGGLYIIVLDVDAGAVSDLVSALTASDEYEHTTRGNIAMFSRDIPEGIGSYLGYAFEGTVWAIVQGTIVGPTTSVNIAADAVASVTR